MEHYYPNIDTIYTLWNTINHYESPPFTITMNVWTKHSPNIDSFPNKMSNPMHLVEEICGHGLSRDSKGRGWGREILGPWRRGTVCSLETKMKHVGCNIYVYIYIYDRYLWYYDTERLYGVFTYRICKKVIDTLMILCLLGEIWVVDL